MKSILLIFMFFSITIHSQDKPPLPEFIDEQAQFPGGQKGFSYFINSNLKYPDITNEKKNLGTCGVKFKIDIDGSVKDIVIIKNVEGCLECDKEAKRLFSIMPKWTPAKNKGKAIATTLAIPIDFSRDSKTNTQTLDTKKEDIYTVVEEMPSFPGGETEKIKFIQKNIKFPDSAIKKQIMGKCYLKFIVTSDGTLNNISILKGVANCPECDEEAKRVISIMPRWKPGKQNGNLVSVYQNIPINFQYK